MSSGSAFFELSFDFLVSVSCLLFYSITIKSSFSHGFTIQVIEKLRS